MSTRASTVPLPRSTQEVLANSESPASHPAPARGPAKPQVSLTYDPNGILEVEAYLPNSSQKFRTVLTHNAAGRHRQNSTMPSANCKPSNTTSAAKTLGPSSNFYSTANPSVGEVSPFHRDELEAAIDSFEYAI